MLIFIFFIVFVMLNVSASGMLFINSLLVHSIPFEFVAELSDASGRPAVFIDPAFSGEVGGLTAIIFGINMETLDNCLRVIVS